jgi:hypothetical protein
LASWPPAQAESTTPKAKPENSSQNRGRRNRETFTINRVPRTLAPIPRRWARQEIMLWVLTPPSRLAYCNRICWCTRREQNNKGMFAGMSEIAQWSRKYGKPGLEHGGVQLGVLASAHVLKQRAAKRRKMFLAKAATNNSNSPAEVANRDDDHREGHGPAIWNRLIDFIPQELPKGQQPSA